MSKMILSIDNVPLETLSSRLNILHEKPHKTKVYSKTILFFRISEMMNVVIPFMMLHLISVMYEWLWRPFFHPFLQIEF